MERETYYVNLHNREITQNETTTRHALTIHATPGEIETLRSMFDQNLDADFSSFFRSHIPIVPYSNSKSNDRFDATFADAVRILYDLGDQEAKNFIEESGIIGHKPLDNDSL